MYCGKCGNKVADSSKFCNICGNVLETDSIPNATANTETPPVNDFSNQAVYANNLPKRELEKNSGPASSMGAAALSIVLAVFLVFTVCLAVVRTILSAGTIKSMISALNFSEIIVDPEKFEEYDLNASSDNLADVIYENIDQSNMKDTLTRREFDAIIENETVAKKLSNIISDKIEDSINGKAGQLITIDEIISVIEDSDKEIADEIGYSITNERIENLRLTLEDKYSDVLKDYKIPKLEKAIGKTPVVILSLLNSDVALILIIIVDVILFALIFFLKRSLGSAFRYSGIALIIISVIFIAVAVLLRTGSLFALGGENIASQLLSQMIGVLSNRILYVSLTSIVVGIVMLVLSFVSNVAKKIVDND